MAVMSRGRLVVPVARRWSKDHRREAVREALTEWYRRHASEQILAAVDRYSKRLGVAAKRVGLREMKLAGAAAGPTVA